MLPRQLLCFLPLLPLPFKYCTLISFSRSCFSSLFSPTLKFRLFHKLVKHTFIISLLPQVETLCYFLAVSNVPENQSWRTLPWSLSTKGTVTASVLSFRKDHAQSVVLGLCLLRCIKHENQVTESDREVLKKSPQFFFAYCDPGFKQQKDLPLVFICFCKHTCSHNLPCRQLQPWTQTTGEKSFLFPFNIPLHPTRNPQLLAQQSLTTAVHKSLEGVQTFTKGGKEGIMTKDAQRSQSAVPGAMAAFGQTFSARWPVHIWGWLCTWSLQRRTALRTLGAHFLLGCRCIPRFGGFLSFPSSMPPCAFSLLLGYSLLEGAVEVDTDSIANDTCILVREREDKGSVVTEAHTFLPHTQAPFWLAEEHNIRGQREVHMVF